MLGKLIKYELKAFGRVMLPLYGALLVASLVFAGTIRISMNSTARSLMEKFAILGGFLFAAAIIAVMVMMVIMVVQRYYRNLLGTEGYLMFTLPVTTLSHILSKAISAFLWVLLGGVTGLVSGGILVYVIGDLEGFMTQFRDAMRMIRADDQLVLNIVLILIVIVAGIMATIFKVYAAISIGHQWSDHRLFGAVLAYIGIGILELAVTSLPWIRQVRDARMNSVTFQNGIWIAVGISLIQILIYGTVAWRLLDRRLNLE